jgi:flagellar motor switch protein FliN/FliY
MNETSPPGSESTIGMPEDGSTSYLASDAVSKAAVESVPEMVNDGPAKVEPVNEGLLDITLEARIQFGAREILLSELLELGSGDVLELDRMVTEPVDLLVGDRIIARGEVVVVGGNFGLHVTEVLTPQPRLESVRCLP